MQYVSPKIIDEIKRLNVLIEKLTKENAILKVEVNHLANLLTIERNK
ncbi:MAG: hypothetical protein RLY43_2046 [Bacteroidota bacterium]|jgi:regulator of replication initiation timing